MHLIILTQYYPPEIGAPQRRLSELAERMVKAGHSVTVLTAMPNYPLGRLHDGYGGLMRRETRDGVEVIRTFIYPTQKAALLHRLSNYFSFVLSSLLIGTVVLRRADFLMVESPPLFLGLSAFWLSAIKRARLIFNVSDLWPESAVRLHIIREGSTAHRLSAWLERVCYRTAWLVSGQSRSILSDIEARFPGKPTFRLSNGVDVRKFALEVRDPAARARIADTPDAIVVLYAGLHGLAQGLAQAVAAAEQLRDDPHVRFVLVGDGPEKAALVADAAARGLDNIRFLDPVPAGDVPALLYAADILLVPLKEFIPGAVPSKLYESMASGRPVLVVAEGEPAEIVHTYEVGRVAMPGDIDAIVGALRELASDPALRDRLGANGRAAAEAHFNRDTIVAGFITHLEQALSPARTR
jgi:glycosyltransferase involved in cell wall biosynthesis